MLPSEVSGMALTVGETAKLARVSVRTLHHYDAVGLLTPSRRTDAGYRLYGDTDLERLQQIMLFRELGFALPDIRRIMTDPGFDRRTALVAQRKLLAEKATRTEAMLDAIDTAIGAMEEGTEMDKEQMFEVFGDFDPAGYEQEVRERWGETGAYRESARRTAGYTKADWLRVKAEQEAITAGMAERMDAGDAPDSPEVQALVERHRLSIDRSFYPCSLGMHAGLGEMYVADPRFAAVYERIRPGMAVFMRDAMRIHAEGAAR
jgi:DNA-binding transcriptional MerR regulator